MLETRHRRHAGSPVTRADHGRLLRTDIEGMRAIAVVSVMAFHAGLPWFSGGFVGVDFFFVLSGFLITGLLAREVGSTGRVRLGTFWARRVKRLLPASAAVLAFSAIVTYLWLPFTQRSAFGGDIMSAALYVVNWRLADRSVDYLAEDVGASPVQHYWSLAVEEQFYLIWPILMLLVGVLAARRWRAASFAVLSSVTVLSFAWSVVQSHSSPQTAFFTSTTRIWELGVGALLALAATRVERLPGGLRAAAGWIGMMAIAYSVCFFDGSTTWPGAAALLPTLGAALMIASGIAPVAGSPQRLLSTAPMVWIGGLSYSLYLWHWPILVAAQAQVDDLAVPVAVLLMLFAVIPAWVCNRYIENPVRFGALFRPSARALALGAALTAAGIGIGFALDASVALRAGPVRATVADSLGARVLTDASYAGTKWSDVDVIDKLRPLPADASDDRPSQYTGDPDCQVKDGDSIPMVCESGDTSGDRTVLIIGDSKVVQWQPLLSDLGRREGFTLVQITKSACPFTDAGIVRDSAADCRAWGRAALQEVLRIDPDLVIASHRPSVALPEGATQKSQLTREAMVDGMVRYWKAITGEGIPLVALLDNPAPSNQPVYECVAQHPDQLSRCSFDKSKGIDESGAPTQRKAAGAVRGAEVMDMTDVVCPDRLRCAPTIGNVLVYRQTTHLTSTYVSSTEPQFSAALRKATDGRFGESAPVGQ